MAPTIILAASQVAGAIGSGTPMWARNTAYVPDAAGTHTDRALSGVGGTAPAVLLVFVPPILISDLSTYTNGNLFPVSDVG